MNFIFEDTQGYFFMTMINTTHLTTIFGVVAMDLQDSSATEALDLLKLDSKADISNKYPSLPHLLDKTGKEIRREFFKSRKDVPRDDKSAQAQQFDKISTFSVKLALIFEACRKLDGKNTQLAERCKKEVQSIIDQAQELFLNSTDLNAQLFLIRKLMLIRDLPQIKNDQKFIAIISPQLALIVTNLCQSVVSAGSNSTPQIVFGDIARFLNQYATVFNRDELSRTFIEATKACFLRCKGPANYSQRLNVITAIHTSWGLLQNKLSLADLNWLQEFSVNIDAEYKKLPARYTKPMQAFLDYAQYLRTWGPLVIGTSAFTGFLSWGLTKFSLALLAAFNEELRTAIKYKAMLPTLNQVRKKIAENFISTYEKTVPKGLTLEGFLKRNEEIATQINGYASWYHYIPAAAGALVASYGIYQYLQSPFEPRPIPLPSWVEHCKSKLDSKETDAKTVSTAATGTAATATAAARHPITANGGPLAAGTAAGTTGAGRDSKNTATDAKNDGKKQPTPRPKMN